MSRLIWLLLVLLCFGCSATVDLPDRPSAGQQWAPCGFDRVCGAELECFGVCTFECGEKYFEQPNGSFEYGFDQASSDRCAALGGTCMALTGIQINVCQLPVARQNGGS